MSSPLCSLELGCPLENLSALQAKQRLLHGQERGWPDSGHGKHLRAGSSNRMCGTFLKCWPEGPTHHFALGVGHRAKSLLRIADSETE